MLNKLLDMIRRYDMICPGDRVTVALSGGADSVALLYGLFLLKDKLKITLEAAHFNHGLRGAESQRDEAFCVQLCDRYDIPLHVGHGHVTAGKKGLEAAARDARYGFFDTIPGKIATAHTADDNAETVLMRLVRGTGLKGLGGITPVRGRILRPMLQVTRREVLAFMQENYLSYVEDSSNGEDAFLRNRLRHHVMPLLTAENPRLGENLSAMAMQLRRDEETLAAMIEEDADVDRLRALPEALRSRCIAAFLEKNGVPEPESLHIMLVEKLVFSGNPSARADLPGGVTVAREYGRLTVGRAAAPLEPVILPAEGLLELPEIGLNVRVMPADHTENGPDSFTVCPRGAMVLRCRQAGDEIRLSGGTKSLKKRMIDRKIPAAQRLRIPVISDDAGILGVYGFGADLDRIGPGVHIRFEKRENNQEESK